MKRRTGGGSEEGMEVGLRWSNAKKRRIRGSSYSQSQGRGRGRGRGDSWSSLPGDILCLVADKIDSIDDYVRFCVVCRSWYLIATEFYNAEKKSDLLTPFHMLGNDPDLSVTPYRSAILYPSDPKLELTFISYGSRSNQNQKRFVLDLPEARGRRCWGSPFGWLVTFGVADLRFSLLNPFSRATIPLPGLSTLTNLEDGFDYYCYDLLKAFLTADPITSPHDCFVFIVFKQTILDAEKDQDYILAYARPGKDTVWCPIHAPGISDLNDIVYFKGKLFGVRANAGREVELVSIQIKPGRALRSSSPRAVKVAAIELSRGDPTLGFPGYDTEIDCIPLPVSRKYLVEFQGELCVVIRYILKPNTGYFKLYKINLSTMKLTRVWPLGDCCLFVGNNISFTFPATSPPPEPSQLLQHLPDTLRSNYVFYTYDDDWLLHLNLSLFTYPDVGVWDMLHSQKIYTGSFQSLTRYPPLWFIPSISFRKLEGSGELRRCSSSL